MTVDEQIIQLEVNIIQPNPLQPRGVINNNTLIELVESIKIHGILEPLVVAKTPAGYQIIAGERRWRAAKMMGLKLVPVIVKETTPRGMLEMALVENVQREDLNALERAQAYKRLLDEFNLTVTEISERVGKSASYISNTLRLLLLPDAIKDGLVSGSTTEGHARALLALEDPKLMVDAYKILLKKSASVREAEELARRLKISPPVKETEKEAKEQSPEMEKIEKELSEILNGKVRVAQSKVGVRIALVMYGPKNETTVKLNKFAQVLKKAFSN
ncbi:MAG: ParB/RepB/Spo0J family partition protein [Patescibacteria group bacterium]|nr:ParB/RepB/Spo0J family partition protein [Patescibacteria group bacterium]